MGKIMKSMLLAVLVCCTIALNACAKPEENIQSEDIQTDAQGNQIMLVEDSLSDYQIVVAKESGLPQELASSELQKFIYDATGCRLPIVTDEGKNFDESQPYLSVGDTAIARGGGVTPTYAELGRTGYRVKVAGKTAIMTGVADVGIMNSVYGFLNREIAFRAYAVDEVYHIQASTIPLYKADLSHVSDIDVKYPYYGETFDAEALLVAARMGFLAGQGGGNGLEAPLFGDGMWLHTTYRIVPPDKYDDHPEWFSNNQLCLTNPELIAVFIENMKPIVANSPKAAYYMIGNADYETICDCESCTNEALANGGNGGVYVRFLNKVSDALNEWLETENPGRKITLVGLAYAAVRKPPVRLDETTNRWVPVNDSVVCHEGTAIMYASNYACYTHAFNDPDCETNEVYRKDIEGWAEITDHFMMYTYGINFSDYFLPFNDFGNIKGNAQYFKSLGVSYIHTQGSTNRNSPFAGLKLYLYSRLWDDSSLDYDALVEDFMAHYYGAAAEDILGYYTDLRDYYTSLGATNDNICTRIYTYIGIDWSAKKQWPKEVLDGFMRRIQNAYGSVAESRLPAERKEVLNNRILALELNIQYYLFKHYSTFYSDTEYSRLYAEFVENCQSLGITRGSEFYDDLKIR